jgi:NAD(P)H-hydrate epimerase
VEWGGTEILGVAEHAMLDQLAVHSGVALETLMENAGRQVANEIAKRWPPQPTFVLSGPGNNGGDGYVVARHLKARGYRVTVLTVGDHSALRDPAKGMAAQWDGTADAWRNTGTVRRGLYVDAIYGAGLNRAIPEDMAAYWYLVRSADCPIVAIDVPSGLHGDKAAFLDRHDWSADLTVTFFRKKPAHVLMPGRKSCGEIVVVDIGVPVGLIQALAEVEHEGALPGLAFAHENEAPDFLPETETDRHKYQRGHVVAVCGPALATGAARMAAHAALRTGAGLATLAASAEAALVCAHHVTAEMVAETASPGALRALILERRVTATVVGPGLPAVPETWDTIQICLGVEAGCVLDAGALTAFQGSPATLFDMIKAKPGAGVVLTPHDGEFERLFPGLRKRAVNKFEAAKLAAQQAGAVVVLKGADTVIASPEGAARVNVNAPPWLATAGSGDVLAGIIAGLMAQGTRPFQAARAGVWLHGAAGTALGPGLIATDLPDILPEVLENIGADPKNAL